MKALVHPGHEADAGSVNGGTYLNSKGQFIPIAGMAHPHLVSAHAKLLREDDGSRAAEIAAMERQIHLNNEAYAEAQVGMETDQ